VGDGPGDPAEPSAQAVGQGGRVLLRLRRQPGQLRPALPAPRPHRLPTGEGITHRTRSIDVPCVVPRTSSVVSPLSVTMPSSCGGDGCGDLTVGCVRCFHSAQPPRELSIQVRVLEDCGEVMTDQVSPGVPWGRCCFHDRCVASTCLTRASIRSLSCAARCLAVSSQSCALLSSIRGGEATPGPGLTMWWCSVVSHRAQ
jgi:hypothetical protein